MEFKRIMLIVFLLSPVWCMAQITLDFPKERQIFQRQNFDANSNFSGDGIIRISGSFSVEYDEILAKVEPKVAGQGTSTSWQTINTRNGKPYFKGSLQAKGGWYKLYVKAIKNGKEVGSATVNRVGIGEVFIIAGQSNAAGGGEAVGLTGIKAVDDRTNVVDYSNSPIDENKLAIGFSKADRDSVSIGPFQFVPWSWAKLGDLLAEELNVPILFFGAAHGGTSIRHWADASQGRITPNIPAWLRMDLRAPYKALESSLKFYSSLTGVRAVLWHQGESDHSTPASYYQEYLETIIAQSRKDIDSESLAWMVAKVSYAGGRTSFNPTYAQQQVIYSDENVFEGPNTDLITGYQNRIDLTHLNTALGVSNHAESWFNSMIKNGFSFFENASDIPANDFLDIDCHCSVNQIDKAVTLFTSEEYQKFAWSNRDNSRFETKGISASGCCTFTNYPPDEYQIYNWQFDSTSTIEPNNGRYALNVRKKESGVVLFSPVVRVNEFMFPRNTYFDGSQNSGNTPSINAYLNKENIANLTTEDLSKQFFKNCEVQNQYLSKSSFSCEELGEVKVDYTVIDMNGDEFMANLLVTVLDTISPTVVAENATVYLNESGNLLLEASGLDLGSFDNCGSVSSSLSKNQFSCSDLGLNKVIYSVTDESGNNSSVELEITVLDTISPTYEIRETSFSLDGDGYLRLTVEDIINVIDNCSISESSISQEVFECSDLGTSTVTIYLTDESGNQSITDLEITVNDNSAICECSYAILASEEVSLDGSNITFGSIGTYQAGKKVIVKDAKLGEQVYIKSDLNQVDESVSTDKLIRGIAPSPSSFESNIFNDKVKKRVWRKKEVKTSEDHFKRLVIGRKASVLFEGSSDIFIKKLKLYKGSALKVSGKSNIFIANKIRFGKKVDLNPERFKLKIFSRVDVVIRKEGSLNSNLHTLGNIKVRNAKKNKPTTIRGLFAGGTVFVGKNVTWSGTATNCDENNPNLRELRSEGLVSLENPVTELLVKEEDGGLSYGPNPTDGELKLFLNFPGLKEKEQVLVGIKVYSSNGKLVSQEDIAYQPQINLDLGDLPSSFYFVEIKTLNFEKTIKVMVK